MKGQYLTVQDSQPQLVAGTDSEQFGLVSGILLVIPEQPEKQGECSTVFFF